MPKCLYINIPDHNYEVNILDFHENYINVKF